LKDPFFTYTGIQLL